jgi:hypothetical protein
MRNRSNSVSRKPLPYGKSAPCARNNA